MKTVFLSLSFLFISTFSFAQTASENRTQPLDDPGFREFKKRHDQLAGIPAGSAQENQGAIKVSEYFGYDEALKSYFIGGVIPTDAPKAITYTSKKEYLQNLNGWIASNKQYLKPEHKNSLITE